MWNLNLTSKISKYNNTYLNMRSSRNKYVRFNCSFQEKLMEILYIQTDGEKTQNLHF
jgi:hypothetical protein